jgi:flavin reductase (DIM6/NTAB) family NADH-FMN oxidoreductase RutF
MTRSMPSALTEFERLMAELEYSLFIVTVAAGGERAGCLVGFASQVSIHPPRFLVGLSVKNRTYRVASKCGGLLVVHFVPEEAEDLAVLFGGQTGDEIDKFARCEWRPGPSGTPVLADLQDWFAGRVLDRLPFGDHWGFLLEPIDGEVHRSGSPLTFHRAKWIEPGHEP